MIKKCDFSVRVGQFLCNCEGIARFRDEAPFVWYKADENGYVLVWDIKDEDGAVTMEALKQAENHPFFSQYPTEQVRANALNNMFQSNLKEPLLKMSTWKNIWDKMGGGHVYEQYFPVGLELALRDISCNSYSWRRYCQ